MTGEFKTAVEGTRSAPIEAQRALPGPVLAAG